MRAYQLLEARGLIETRPRSGYYVSESSERRVAEPRKARSAPRTTRVDVSELVFQILDAARDRDVVPFARRSRAPRCFRGGGSRAISAAARVTWIPGARRKHAAGQCRPAPADRAPLSQVRHSRFGGGDRDHRCALEALNLSLQVLTRPGDAVAIEAPAFYGCLQAVEMLGLKAVEIPTNPRDGVDLGALAQAIERHAIRACWLMTRSRIHWAPPCRSEETRARGAAGKA